MNLETPYRHSIITSKWLRFFFFNFEFWNHTGHSWFGYRRTTRRGSTTFNQVKKTLKNWAAILKFKFFFISLNFFYLMVNTLQPVLTYLLPELLHFVWIVLDVFWYILIHWYQIHNFWKDLDQTKNYNWCFEHYMLIRITN